MVIFRVARSTFIPCTARPSREAKKTKKTHRNRADLTHLYARNIVILFPDEATTLFVRSVVWVHVRRPGSWNARKYNMRTTVPTKKVESRFFFHFLVITRRLKADDFFCIAYQRCGRTSRCPRRLYIRQTHTENGQRLYVKRFPQFYKWPHFRKCK